MGAETRVGFLGDFVYMKGMGQGEGQTLGMGYAG